MSEPSNGPGRGRVRSRLKGVTLDLTPLRVSRDFRLVWAGTFVSELGYQFTRVALYVQVWQLTRSTAAVGFLGLTGLLGQVGGALVGGTFIDARDRRRILVWSQVALAGVTGVLLASTVLEQPPLAILYAANTTAWFVGAIEGPARSAMVPRLVGKDLVPAALALSQVLWQTVQIVGPAVAGVLIDLTGFGAAYLIDLVSYGALFVAALLMRPMPPEVEPGEDPVGLAASLEGFRYVARHRLLQSTFVIDLVAMIFGMPAALFPALALSQFDRGTAVVGLLFAAPSVGALVQALVGGWVGRIHRQGEAVIWAVIGWGTAIAAFGLVGDRLWLALVFLAIAGAADVVSAIFRSTILQVTVPDHLRGRLSGIFMLVVAGGPKLGDFEAGLVAAAFSPTVSVVSGGLLCIVGAGVTAAIYPELRRYRSDRGVRPPASEAEVEGRAEGEP